MHHLKIVVCALLSGIPVFAQMQPVVTGTQGSGSIDWSKRFIVATGIGAPNPDLPEAAQRPAALRAAQQIALRNALETIKGIFLNSSTTVQNFMVANDVVSSSVSGYLKGFEQEGREKYMSDGSVEISMKVPLDGVGGLGEMLLGTSITDQPAISKFEGKKAKTEHIFTGLIINCKGLSIKPALSPRVLDESGREVYGSAYVAREWAIKYGVVGYAKEVEAAAKLVDRLGKNPGQVKGQKAHGDNATDVVINNDDAADIRSAAKNLKFLSECRVIFVVD
ncbi:MAG: hypothetical protein JW913_08480 [Chitinispirillaceae bacterium]|nr:hypothetical protein [Chitinispirillaceae bacterium]